MWDQHDGESAFRELPYYKNIVKSFLQKQIQYLLEQMSHETGEESVIMTVNIQTGTMSHLGSKAGKAFLDDREDLKTQFMTYCITNYSFLIPGYEDTVINPNSTGIERKYSHSTEMKHLAKTRKRKTTSRPSDHKPKETFQFDLSLSLQKEPDVSALHTNMIEDQLGDNDDNMTDNSDRHRLKENDDLSQSYQQIQKIDNETQRCFGDKMDKDVSGSAKVVYDSSQAEQFSELHKPSFKDISAYSSLVRNYPDNRPHEEYKTGLEEYPEVAKSMTVLVEELSGNIIKTEPLSEEEDSPVQPPAAISNKYLSTDGVVSITRTGHVLRQNKKPDNKPRQMLTIAEKFQILQDMEANPHLSHRELASRHNAGRSTVGLIARNKSFYREQYDIYAESPRKRFSTCAKYFTLNDMVWKWYSESRQSGLLISGTMVKEKALEFAKELSETEFKASNGWLASWQGRYNVKSFRVSGESKLNAIAVTDWSSYPQNYDNEMMGGVENSSITEQDEQTD